MQSIRWGWILLGGFFAELAIIVIVLPLSWLAGQESLLYTAPAASFAAAFVFGAWVSRKASRHRVVHGLLVGVVATLIYVGISFGQPEPVAYLIAHALKVLGGAMGGYVSSRRTADNDRQQVANR